MNEQPVGAPTPTPNPEAEFMRQMMQDTPEPPKKKSHRLLWVIIASIVFLIAVGVGTMVLVRSNSTAQTTTASSADNSYNTEISSSATGCLMAVDLKKNGVTTISQETLDAKGAILLSHIGFKPDATEYLDATAAEKGIATAATLYKGTSSNDYNFEIVGTIRPDSPSAASKVLANQRAAKVKDALVSAGVDAKRMVVGTPASGASTSDTNGNTDRSVTVSIAQPATCHEQ